MKYRDLDYKKLTVSEVGLGCWQLGGDWGKDISEDNAFAIMNKAVENGVTFFDTADVYGAGKSEELIGKFLKSTETNIKVATKFGRDASVFPDNFSEKALRQSVENSLRRLGLDSIDLLQLHCIPPDVLYEGVIFDWLRQLKQEGLIKAFGASVETIEEGLFCIEQEGITSLQIIFNVLRQKALDELLPKAKKKNIGIIVRLPLASGLLTGKFNKETTFADSDHRNFNKNGEAFNVGETFAGLPFEKGVELSKAIEEKFLPQGLSMAQFSQRWILDHDAVTCIIPGASSPAQIDSNCSTSEISELSSELHLQLKAFYKNNIHEYIRGVY
ncbi:aldo/keto reductase [Winogradskyella sp. SYSU M77433]|uniref:aldo/keto reductase n=1 Tax=Winogradskyella sp. SYSU M77433 TaxID=3042722 RepID=UPI002480DCAE|nr:aldo/keto reductase [Winogradskyella sp. SYSU M77433]MDH7911703.1 aldo/keto reductase [Winogradskyella sp. SYSU M77433]